MITRRDVIKLMASASVAAQAPRARAQESRLTMPAEWQRHAGSFMAMCAARKLYPSKEYHEIRKAQARIARAVARFEPVTMLANPGDLANARRLCGDSVEIVEVEHFDIWTRDTLPSFVLDGRNQITAVSWNFNVWGEKFRDVPGYAADRKLARRLATALGFPITPARIVAEGGAIETDGQGTLLTTETCLLNENRNNGLSRSEIETELKRLTGARKIIWLFGERWDRITNGHIDGIARFVRPGLVVVAVSDEPQSPEFEDASENLRRLERATDADGRKLDVVPVKFPRRQAMPPRRPYAASSYVNVHIANGGIIMARFGDEQRDEAARDLWSRLYPGYEVIQIDAPAIFNNGGGVHCTTQQLPAV